MKTIFKQLFLLTGILLLLNACTKEEMLREAKLTITFKAPKDISITKYKNVKIVLTELNTGTKFKREITEGKLFITVPQGSYNLMVDGEIDYTFKGTSLSGGIAANEDNLQFIKMIVEKEIELSLKSLQKDFLIEEIFFAGTVTPEGKQYNGDKYFKIYNNTSETLYADGLLIAESSFLTVDKQDYTPNIIKEAFTAGSIIAIPGSGKDYPIKPGEHIIIADEAINHKENNANSFDLSKVNFEFYYKSMNDVDNPAVPNTINVYNRMVIHNRGFKTYVIARLPKKITNEQFIKENEYTYNWIFTFGQYSFNMDGKGVKIPNEWIIDAVNLSVESEFQWIVTDPSLDSGWTYCGKVDKDKTRYNKSVRRKVIQNSNGIRLLQDTNNSTVDFDAEVTPSVAK